VIAEAVHGDVSEPEVRAEPLALPQGNSIEIE
jgi:hypothetical protein